MFFFFLYQEERTLFQELWLFLRVLFWAFSTSHLTYFPALHWQSPSFHLPPKMGHCSKLCLQTYSLSRASALYIKQLIRIFIERSHRHFQYNISFPTFMLASVLNLSPTSANHHFLFILLLNSFQNQFQPSPLSTADSQARPPSFSGLIFHFSRLSFLSILLHTIDRMFSQKPDYAHPLLKNYAITSHCFQGKVQIS